MTFNQKIKIASEFTQQQKIIDPNSIRFDFGNKEQFSLFSEIYDTVHSIYTSYLKDARKSIYSNKSEVIYYKNIKNDIQIILLDEDTEIYNKLMLILNLIPEFPLDTENIPEIIQPYFIKNDQRWARMFLEKIYFDLFHDYEHFQPQLIKYLDPKTGDLVV